MESRKIIIIKYFAGFYNTKIIWVDNPGTVRAAQLYVPLISGI